MNSAEYIRKMSDNLSKLTGLSARIVPRFLHLLERYQLHEVACKACDADTRLKSVDITIPYIGTITVEIDGKDISNSTIVLDERFKSELLSAVTTGESLLVQQSDAKLVKTINNRYNSLI